MQISNLGSLFFLAIPSSHPLTLQSTLFSVTSVPSSSPPSRYLFFIVALVNSQWQSSWKDPCHPSWPVISAPTSPVTTLRPVILKHGTVTPLYSKAAPMGCGQMVNGWWWQKHSDLVVKHGLALSLCCCKYHLSKVFKPGIRTLLHLQMRILGYLLKTLKGSPEVR